MPQQGKSYALCGVFFVLLHEGEEQGTVLAVADGASVVAEHDLLKLVEDGARKTASDDAEIKGGYHAPDHTIAMRLGLSHISSICAGAERGIFCPLLPAFSP